ncbi:hypothetical protein ACEPAG_1907 [Sanghuangporus baumii]
MPTQSSLHFCSECNNMLYPKADQQRRVMVYACRICDYDEIGENKCVYRNDLLTVTKEQMGVIADVASDPTLSHSTDQTCPNCGHHDSVYFQDQSKRRETRMILFYVCTNCSTPFTDPALQVERKRED